MDNGTEEKSKQNIVRAFLDSIPVCRDGYREPELARNALWSLIIWAAMLMVCMPLMLVMASRKTIVIAESAEDVSISTQSQVVNFGNLTGNKYSLAMQDTDGNTPRWELTNTLVIPMAKGLGAADVSIENHAITREIWIYLWGEDATYPAENPLFGDISKIEYGIYEVQETGIVMKMYMDKVYDLKSTMDNGRLTITLNDPRDKFDLIAVVDPDEEDAVAMAVSRLLLKSNVGDRIKIYSTRYGNEDATDEEIRQLIDEVRADIYIGLGTVKDVDPSRYGIGCEYNDRFFIPGFGSLELADGLTRATVISTVNRAVAPKGMSEGLPMELSIPAAKLNLGYASNPTENELMNSAEYQNKLAAGIVNCIKGVYSDIVENDTLK